MENNLISRNYSVKSLFNLLLKNFGENGKNLIYVLLVSFVILGTLVLAHLQSGIDYWHFMRDPVVLLDGPLYTGYFSQLGCMILAATAGICFLAAGCVKSSQESGLVRSFFYYATFLTTFLCMDDLFMFHDEIFPYFGIHENVFIMGYVGIVSIFFYKYYKVILNSDFVLLGLAFLCFGLSIILDKIPYAVLSQLSFNVGGVIYEDGIKMVGIIFWVFYFYAASKKNITISAGEKLTKTENIEKEIKSRILIEK